MIDSTPTEATYPALKAYVAGEWLGVEGRRTQEVLNPATGKALGELPVVDSSDLDRALEAAAAGFRAWRQADPHERAAVLAGAARLLRERADSIARNATLEEGKTLTEARQETLAAAGLFDFYAGEAVRLYGRVLMRPPGKRTLVTKEPVGPVAAFSPWNFPVHNPVRKLGAPIATGCSVILKPAEETPASAIAVLEALLEAGLPANVAQLVFGVPDEISRHLLASPIIRKLSFTGSTAVGRQLMRLSADTVKKMTLELGGHAPVIIFDDCDLDTTVETLAAAKFRNAGQVCVSPTRFYIQEGIYDRFVAAVSDRSARVNVTEGLAATADMGPMANPRRPASVESMIGEAVSDGARIVTGGERIDRDGFFYRPTVLADVPVQTRAMNEEPFGPVILARPFKSFDEAVAEANRLPFGLAAFAFTENGRQANRIADALESGMVGINTARVGASDAPFQGVKQSGHGSEDGSEGLEACLVTKTIHMV
ncbi:MAG: NAD-dependent succinate-semialdehyde dehydrogenase [Gammaproteobacteria bacterium]